MILVPPIGELSDSPSVFLSWPKMLEIRPIQTNGPVTFENKRLKLYMGAYAGAARRCVHPATVLLRPPSDHRPRRRQARHAHIIQIGLHLTKPRSTRAALSMVQPPGSRQGSIRWAGSSAGSRNAQARRGVIDAHELCR